MVHQNKSAACQQKQKQYKATFRREPREIFQPIDEQIEDNPQHSTHQHALYQAVKVVLPCEAFDFLYQLIGCRHIQYRIACKNREFPRKRRNYVGFGQQKRVPSPKLFRMSHMSDSNQRPTHYECVALPTELKWLLKRGCKSTTICEIIYKLLKKILFNNFLNIFIFMQTKKSLLLHPKY